MKESYGCGVLLGMTLLIAPPAQAVQPASESPLEVCSKASKITTDPARAEQLFAEGLRAAKAGNWAEARERFAESQESDPSAGTLLNGAKCELELGELARAWDKYREAAVLARCQAQKLPENSPERRARLDQASEAERAAEELALKLAFLKLAISGEPKWARIEVDGKPIHAEEWRVPHALNPGAHRVLARAENGTIVEQRVHLEPGTTEQVLLHFPEAPNAPPLEHSQSSGRQTVPSPRVPVQPRAQPTPWQKEALYWSGGTFLVGLGAAGTFTVLALQENANLRDACGPAGPDHCPLDKYASARPFAEARDRDILLANVSGAVSLAALGFAAYCYFAAKSGAEQRTQASAWLTGRAGGVAMSVRF